MGSLVAWSRLVPACFAGLFALGADDGPPPLQPLDVFQLEFAADPQIAPDGERVVYVRTSMDVMEDRRRQRLWMIDSDGADHRPLGDSEQDASSPRWSPDGSRLAFVSGADGDPQLYVRWMDTGEVARLAQLPEAPSGLSWSPDGRWLAFSMLVPDPPQTLGELPQPPEGATWADPPRIIRDLVYREDGAGYVEPGHAQLFVLPADGGTPRQLTSGPFDHGGRLAWMPDGEALVFSANRGERAEFEPLAQDLYALALADGALTRLTDRQGPEYDPAVSPDGRHIAYLGFDDRRQGYQVTQLSVLDTQSGAVRTLAADLDRDIEAPVWSADGSGLYVQYDDLGDTRIAHLPLDGEPTLLADRLGGTSLGRPYGGGSFSVADDGRIAFTQVSTERPADVAVVDAAGVPARRLTALNDDLLGNRALGAVEEFWVECVSTTAARSRPGWSRRPTSIPSASIHCCSRSTAGPSPTTARASRRSCSSSPPPASSCST